LIGCDRIVSVARPGHRVTILTLIYRYSEYQAIASNGSLPVPLQYIIISWIGAVKEVVATTLFHLLCVVARIDYFVKLGHVLA
jgi:hypothetical protein